MHKVHPENDGFVAARSSCRTGAWIFKGFPQVHMTKTTAALQEGHPDLLMLRNPVILVGKKE